MATKRGCRRQGRAAPKKKGGKCGKKLRKKKCKNGRTKSGKCRKKKKR